MRCCAYCPPFNCCACVCTGDCCFKCRKDGNKFNLGPKFYQIPLDTLRKGLNIKGRTGLAVAKPHICGKSLCAYSVQASFGSSVIRTVRSLGRWQSCASTLNWSMVTTGLSAAQSVARSGSEPVNWDFTWPSTRGLGPPSTRTGRTCAQNVVGLSVMPHSWGHTSSDSTPTTDRCTCVRTATNALCTLATCTNISDDSTLRSANNWSNGCDTMQQMQCMSTQE